LKVKSVGRLCLLGGVGPTYRRLLPPHYYDILVEPEGDALDGAFKLAKGDLLACAHGKRRKTFDPPSLAWKAD